MKDVFAGGDEYSPELELFEKIPLQTEFIEACGLYWLLREEGKTHEKAVEEATKEVIPSAWLHLLEGQ